MKLDSLLSAQLRLVEIQKKALSKMGVSTARDLLYYFPIRYGNTNQIKNIKSLIKGDDSTIFGRISKLKMSKAFIKKIPMSDAIVEDSTGKIKLVWFNQPYIAKMIHDGQLVRVEGKIAERRGELYMSNPKIEVIGTLPNLERDSIFCT